MNHRDKINDNRDKLLHRALVDAGIRPAFSAKTTPAQPSEPMPLTAQRFSRSLDERNPHTRSSQAYFVPMYVDREHRMHVADRIVMWGCAAALAIVIALVLIGEIS